MGDNDAPLLLDVSRLVWRRWTGTRPTGIDRICFAWLKHYAPHAQAVVIHRYGKAILSQRASRALFQALLRPDRANRDVTQFRRDIAGLALRHGAQLRDCLSGRGRLWLNPGHTGLDAKGLKTWCNKREVRPVYLVHDLIPITNPEFCREGEDERHRLRMRTVLSTAAGVVANSAHTLETLKDFARQEETAMPLSIAVWPGTPRLPVVASAKREKATFLVIGTIEGRKNHQLLLSVWQQILESAGPDRILDSLPQLVIVGRRGWRADDVFAALDNHDFHGCVHEVGPLGDAQLFGLLKDARALLFPSFAEGFGIPIVEALAMGVPVIASDLPVFREIGQGVPDLLLPGDRNAWRATIQDYSKPESEKRAAQMKRMTTFQPYEWSNHFAELDDFLRTL